MITYDGLDAVALATRLGVPVCVTLARVSSTLDVIHELAGQGRPPGILVLAEEQTNGRGRLGRRWHSPAGKGIWLGYLLRPEGEIESGVIGLRVGLSVVATLQELGVSVQLRWPNDLVSHDRKLGGILCEARWRGAKVSWLAIGVGLNMYGPLPDHLADQAIALETLLPEVTRLAVLERLVPRLNGLSEARRLLPEEHRAFQAFDWLYGRELAAPVIGRARGIHDDGSLLVETPDGVQRVVGGSVVTT